MSTLLPREVDDFLFALGAFEEGAPDEFEVFARAEANRLWARFVMFPDESIRLDSTSSSEY